MAEDAPDWKALGSPIDSAQQQDPSASPDWKTLGAPVSASPISEDTWTPAERLYRAHGNSLWVHKLTNALTFGLNDKLEALTPAAIGSAAKGINSLYKGVNAEPPFPEAEGDNFSDVYHQELARLRGGTDIYSQAHPVAAGAADALGTAASMAVPVGNVLRGGTLGAKVLAGAKSGATVGGLGGFGQSNDESFTKDLIQTAVGTTLGAGLGAGTAYGGEKVVAPLANWVAGRFGADAVGDAATKQILDRISKSESGGGPTAQDMLDLIAANKSKPLMLADVGGVPVQGLGERIATTSGAGQQIAASALTSRDAGAGRRIADELGSTLGSGDANFATEQALTQSRAAAAVPAYEEAGIPSDPAQYASAPTVDNPKIANILAKSKAVQSAIAQAKDRPAYAELPDNSMVLLDKAYKNIGGAANAAKISGNGELARDLNGERADLLDAITNGNKDHPYHAALKAYSGPSQSIGALSDGATFMVKSPEQITAEVGKLSPNDQEFYRLGAANALKTQIAKTSQGGNEALKISGNDYVKQQIKALTGSDAAADRLINSADLESKMFQTKTNTLGNSRTAGRLAEQAASNGESGVGGDMVQMAAGAMTSEPVVSGMGAVSLGRKLFQAMGRPSPKVDAATARMLFNPNQESNQQVLARIIAMGKRPSMTTSLTRPIVQAGAQFLPSQMNLPFTDNGQ